MKIAILVLVVIGALLVITSGVWVAFALISAISPALIGKTPEENLNSKD